MVLVILVRTAVFVQLTVANAPIPAVMASAILAVVNV